MTTTIVLLALIVVILCNLGYQIVKTEIDYRREKKRYGEDREDKP